MKRSQKKNIIKIAITLFISVVICTAVFMNNQVISNLLFNIGDDSTATNNNIGTPNTSVDESQKNASTTYLSQMNDGIIPSQSSVSTGYRWDLNDIDSGKFHILVVDRDGFVFARGSNEWKQLGVNDTSSTKGTSVGGSYSTSNYYNYFQPVVALNHLTVTKVAAGGYHSLAIGYDYTQSSSTASAYQIYAWGRQGSGRLGNATTSDTASAALVNITSRFSFASGEYPIDVEAGEHHSMLLTNLGNVYTWGENARGQVGNGSTADRSTPYKTSLSNIDEISAGSEHCLARNSSNKLYAWGDNSRYQCALTGSYYTSPQAIHSSYTYSKISAGELHNVGLLTNGYLRLWGDARGGKLSNGYTSNSDSRQTNVYHTSRTYTDIAAGGGNTLALTSDGKVWITGYGVDTYFDKSHTGYFVESGQTAKKAVYNGGMMIMIGTNDYPYVFGYASKYDENWYGRPLIEVAPGIYDTSPPYPTYNVTKDTAEALRVLTPPANILGLPTNYNRTEPHKSVPTDGVTFYNTRVKINCFYSSYTDFRIAQVPKTIYDAGGTFSGATFKTIGQKGAIINKEGYYVVRFRRGDTTSGTITYKKFTISNKEGPEIELDNNSNKHYNALINLYDGFGLKSVRVQGTSKTYNPATGGYTTSTYDRTDTMPANTYNYTCTVYENSNTTFTVTATDNNNVVSTKSIKIDTVVTIINQDSSYTYDNSRKTVAPTFHRPLDGQFNLSTFNSRFNTNGYTVDSVYYDGGTGFTAGTTGPIYAGSYNATITVRKSSSAIDSKIVGLNINKRNLTLTAANKSKIYGDSDPALTYTQSGTLASGDSLAFTLKRASGNTVGTYSITQNSLTLSNSSSYNVNVINGAFTINKRAITVTAQNKSKTYGDNDPSLTHAITSGSLVYSDSFTGSLTRQSGDNVGTYSIYQGSLAFSSNANCYTLTFVPGTLTINKRNITVTAVAASKTYGQSDPTFGYTITSGSLAYSDSFSGALSRESGTNVGSYNILIGSLSPGNNYNVTFVSKVFTINKKQITIKADDKQITYGDNAPSYTITYTGLVGGDTLSDTVSCSYQKNDNAGNYTITVASKSYTNYTATYQQGTLQVSKKSITIRPNNINITYGDTLPAITFDFSDVLSGDTITATAYVEDYSGNAGTYDIIVNPQTYTNYLPSYETGTLYVSRAMAVISGEDTQIYTYNGQIQNIVATLNHSECEITYTDQQGYKDYSDYPYYITARSAQTTNYYPATKQFTLIINKKDISIKADDITVEYGYSDPALTYTATGLATGDTLSGSLMRDFGTNVGEYQIKQGTLSVGNNYNLTGFTPGVFTITRRNIEVTAQGRTKIYGENDPSSFNYDITSGTLVFGENLSGSLSRQSGENAGTYEITQGSLTNANNANYNIIYVSATFTISRRNITIAAIDKSKTYGESDPDLEFDLTSGYIMEGDTLQGNLLREAGEAAGTYDIIQGTVNNANNSNYNITFVSRTFVINKKAITVTAQNKTITYGDAVPTFTFVYSGLEFDDTLTDSATTSYNRYYNVGTFSIVVTEKVYDNYIATYVDGTLTVTQKAITIKADNKQITYGQQPPVYTISYTGLVNNDELNDTISADYNIYDNAGTYDIIVTERTYTNYVATYQKGTLTVAKKTITITPQNETIVYGEELPSFTISYSGLINDDTLTDTAITVYQRYDDAGSYEITIVPKTYTNYTPDYKIATLTVNKAALTVIAENQTIIYGDVPPVYTVSYEGLINGDTLTDTATSSYQRYNNVGTYTITVSQRVYTNYTPAYIDGTLTVNKKNLTISADSKQITYGDVPPVYTISYAGLVNNDQLGDTLYCSYERYDNADVYDIIVNQKTYTNYNPTYNNNTLTVNKKAVTITAQNKTITYGEAVPQFTFEYIGLLNNDILTDTASTTYNRYDNVGSFDIVVTEREYTNYTPTYNNGTLTVNKAPLTVTVEDEQIGYGTATPVFRFSYIGLINNDVLTTVATTTYSQYDDVGEYPITITTTSYTNYQPTFNHGMLYVGKGTAVIIAETTQLHYYDRTTKYVEAQLNHTETELVFTPSSSFIDVGIYYVTVTSAATTNYSAASVEITFIIDKRQVFINVDHKTKVYGEVDPALTFTHTGLFEGDSVTGSLVREEGEVVGSYDILLGTVTAGDNYQIEFTGSTLDITPRPLTLTAYSATKVYGYDDPEFNYDITDGNLIGTDTLTGKLSRVEGRSIGDYEITLGTVSNSNYSLTLISEYLTIAPRPITITADDISKMYGEADPMLTYTITSGSLAYDDTISDTVSREPGEDVGVYAITINQSSNNNYDVSYEGNLFTIYERPITITAHSQSKVYGYDDEDLTYYVSQGELVFGDVLAGELIRQAGQNKGVYNILQGTITNTNNTNYDITYVGATYTITERDITLAAQSKQKIYGESDPELTYTITVGSLGYADVLNGSITRTAGEDVDTYTIYAGTVTSQNNTNYNITFIENDFIITRRPITVEAMPLTKTYGYNDPPFLYNITEGNLVFDDVLNGTLAREDNQNQGIYPIEQGTLNNTSNSNYDITYIGSTFTIYPRYITIKADYTIKYYGESDPVLTYRVTSGALAYSDSLNGALGRELGEERGEYAINQGTIQNSNNNNYDITFISDTFEIVKCPITVEAVATSKIYGDDDQELTYVITQGSTAEGEVLLGTLVRQSGENVGEYLISAGTLTNEYNDNYEITFIERNFTITRRPLTLTPDEKEKTYGYADPALTYEITAGNLVFEDTITGELVREEGENVGEYLILHGSLSNENNPNYDIILVDKYFTINKRALELIADSDTKIYGNGDPVFTYGIFYGSLVAGDELTGSLSRMPGENTGTYPITLGTLGNDNYELVVTMGNLIILPRPITVKADDISFLHGSQDHIEYTYTITGNPLPEDEETIREAIKVSSSARPDSRVAEYPINISQVRPLNNYSLTLVPDAKLNILPGKIKNVFFKDMNVLYDGYEHTILATGDVDKYNVEYRHNVGIDVGVYRATAIFTKENYQDLTLNARLIIMTNQITTSEMVPQGILTIDEGVDPYVIPIIMQNANENVAALAQAELIQGNAEREIISKIFNISLSDNGASVELEGTAEIKLLIPENVNVENLRLLHITDDYAYDVAFVVEGDYVVFTADELGDYAFITTTEEVSPASIIASVLYYTGIGVLGILMILLIVGTFKKRKKANYSKFV